jgi:hypothetical protein
MEHEPDRLLLFLRILLQVCFFRYTPLEEGATEKSSKLYSTPTHHQNPVLKTPCPYVNYPMTSTEYYYRVCECCSLLLIEDEDEENLDFRRNLFFVGRSQRAGLAGFCGQMSFYSAGALGY